MFKNSLLLVCLILLAPNLLVAQKVDSVNNKELIMARNTDSNKIKSKSIVSSEQKDSSQAKMADSLANKSKEIISNVATMPEKLDSIWLKTGDTLIGKITIDKDRNVLLFSKDTIQNLELKASEVVKLIILPKKDDEERADVFSVFNEFYFLESRQDVPIRIFVNRTFKPILNNGPKYYLVQTKYCLFKNDIPYFMKNGRFKETLMFLVNDCKTVIDGFKNGKYNQDNFIEAVTQYNRCNDK
jgi:hypothetical protein